MAFSQQANRRRIRRIRSLINPSILYGGSPPRRRRRYSDDISGTTTSTTKRKEEQQQQQQHQDAEEGNDDSIGISSSSSTSSLQWESFEYGVSPKWDERFDCSRTVIAANEEELEVIRQEETIKDEETARILNRRHSIWNDISTTVIQDATVLLEPFVTNERKQRISKILKQRTRHTRFLYENPSNPSNVWSCLRTIDSFGIQYVDVIIQSNQYRGKASISQKRGMRTAMGSAQWLTICNYSTTQAAINTIRKQNPNIRILAADVNPTSKYIRNIHWDSHNNKKKNEQEEEEDQNICIVMGNEENGITDEMRHLVDDTFTLPMCGFAESYNLSVATAITLAHLSAASSRSSSSTRASTTSSTMTTASDESGITTTSTTTTTTTTGPLRPGDLSKHEYNCLYLKGLLNSMPNKRSNAILKKAGVILPKEII